MDEMDPIDRALSREPEVQPSPGFTQRVMREVHRVADEPEPLAFPTTAFATGLAAMLLLVTLGWFAAADAAQAGGPGAVAALSLDSTLELGLVLAFGAVAASLLLAAWVAIPARRVGF